MAVNVYASATESGSGSDSVQQPNQSGSGQLPASGTVTIDCPDVGQKLTDVPAAAKSQVDTELATLDKQITEAYARLAATRQAQANDGDYVQNDILGPLKDKRTEVIGRIKADYQQVGDSAPDTIDGLATCTAMPADPAPTPPAARATTARRAAAGRTTVSRTTAIRSRVVPPPRISSTSRRSRRTSRPNRARSVTPRPVRSPRSAVPTRTGTTTPTT